MSIFVIGINYKTASVALREKMYFARDLLPFYLQDVLSRGVSREAVLISTCNRSELYCEANEAEKVRDWFLTQTTLSRQEIASALYVYQGQAAVAHIMRVACGLDSMVLGEPQILGQMKEAFSESCTAGAVGALFHRLFQQVFAVAKEIRATTAIGACPVSMASAAVHFAKQQLPDLTQANVVLIGAGEATELLMRYLAPQLTQPVKIVNRTLEKAALLTQEWGSRVYGLEQLLNVLSEADIVFSATGSAVPIVNKDLMEKVMQARAKPITFIDIAVPRDIDAAVTEIDQVKLFCIDDLKAIIEKNRHGREHAADKAQEMIGNKSREFFTESQSYDTVTHTIRAYRGQMEEICHAELAKARHQLQQGVEPEQVLEAFAHAFTQKLLHVPSVQLRQAAAEGRIELLSLAKELFAIPDPETERI